MPTARTISVRLAVTQVMLVTLLSLVPAASAAPRRAPRRRSGVMACLARLPRIAWQRLRGRRPCVVFDIDNTVADARGRTQKAAHRFAAEHGVAELKLPLSRIGYDGTQTAHNAKVPQHANAFQRAWERFFWRGENMRFDKPVKRTILLAKLAKLFGAEVIYLTGRIEALRDASVKQLADLGLPDARKANVICKPDLSHATVPFKVGEVQRIAKKRPIAWYVSDTPGEVAAIHRVAGDKTKCVLVDFPVGASAERLPPEIPAIKIRP